MAKNNSEEINFQLYVDLVKQNKFHWNIFIAVMQDLSYSDTDKLRNLNAILLNELTINYSDMDKLKYLNILLLTELKNSIQSENHFQNEHIVLEDTSVTGLKISINILSMYGIKRK